MPEITEEMKNNLQNLLWVLGRSDDIDRLGRKLIEASNGYSNLTFIETVGSIASLIFASDPRPGSGLENAKSFGEMIVSMVTMLQDQTGRSRPDHG